uniref:Uncharacterized protein n=1 Tax=Timema tahoe TaxID=61484 RepID=A0A7R9FL91_9NEOP|nr:unnamed protein product [Timema tahoe]
MWAEVGKVVVEYITYLCTKITIDSQSAMTSGCLEQIEGSYVKKAGLLTICIVLIGSVKEVRKWLVLVSAVSSNNMAASEPGFLFPNLNKGAAAWPITRTTSNIVKLFLTHEISFSVTLCQRAAWQAKIRSYRLTTVHQFMEHIKYAIGLQTVLRRYQEIRQQHPEESVD